MLDKLLVQPPKPGPAESKQKVTTSLLGITHRSISSEDYDTAEDIDKDRRRDEQTLIVKGVIAAIIGTVLIYGGIVGMTQDKAIYDREEDKVEHQSPGQQVPHDDLPQDIRRRHPQIGVHNLEFFGGMAVIAQSITSMRNRIDENSEAYDRVKRKNKRPTKTG